jgi:hypothetical protein
MRPASFLRSPSLKSLLRVDNRRVRHAAAGDRQEADRQESSTRSQYSESGKIVMATERHDTATRVSALLLGWYLLQAMRRPCTLQCGLGSLLGVPQQTLLSTTTHCSSALKPRCQHPKLLTHCFSDGPACSANVPGASDTYWETKPGAANGGMAITLDPELRAAS